MHLLRAGRPKLLGQRHFEVVHLGVKFEDGGVGGLLDAEALLKDPAQDFGVFDLQQEKGGVGNGGERLDVARPFSYQVDVVDVGGIELVAVIVIDY
jgi:hypothetical protein